MSPRILVLAGRVLLSVIFILSGLSKIMDWTGTQQYMAAKGMPFIPILLAAAVIVEIAGGLSVLLGWQARWAALLLFLYLIPTSLIFHNFWALSGMERQTEMVNFLKNLAIMGGLLLVVAYDRTVPLAHRVPADASAEPAAPPLRRAG